MKCKWIGIPLVLLLLAMTSLAQNGHPVSSVQRNEYNHAEAGAFLNYLRLHNAADANFYGLGGRLGFNVSHHVQLEAEGAYDFTQDVRVGSGGGTFTPSSVRIVHFLFGPKIHLNAFGPVRVYVTAKGGLMDFSSDTNFGSQVTSIPTRATDAVFYPGGGIEFFAGWLGMRFEAGDEMYFDRGVNHNLRITAGPVIRF